jgi:hypothetical protein
MPDLGKPLRCRGGHARLGVIRIDADLGRAREGLEPL